MARRSMNFPGLTICGRLAQCWLFVHRTPVDAIAGLLPPPLAPVTHGGFAFWNIVVCRLEAMRPPLVPAALGFGYWHVAYRLHARAERRNGEPLEGLHFLRSDCDRRVMELAGNRLTDFRFHLAKMHVAEEADAVRGTIVSPDAAATFEIDRTTPPQVAPGSPFASLEAAAQALEYRPAALTPVDASTLRVVTVQRDPAAWSWRPVRVKTAWWQFLADRETALELCYEVAPVDYVWAAPQLIPVRPCIS